MIRNRWRARCLSIVASTGTLESTTIDRSLRAAWMVPLPALVRGGKARRHLHDTSFGGWIRPVDGFGYCCSTQSILVDPFYVRRKAALCPILYSGPHVGQVVPNLLS